MKPRLPLIIVLLGLLAIVGLIALGIAAFTAFSQVAGFWQALAASVLIEAAMVTEAVTIIRRNWWGAGGVLVSLIISGTYNYIQAAQAGKLVGLTNGWQLLTLAVGPLSALLFLSLTIGVELRRHEEAVAKWDAEQKRKAEEAHTKIVDDRKAAVEADRQERERLELARIEAETKVQIARVRAEERERARNFPQDERKETVTFRDWRSLPDEDKAIIAGMSTAEISAAYGVSPRTARNWKTNAPEKQNGKAREPVKIQ